MNRDAVKWIVGAIAVLGLAVVSLILGQTLLPSSSVAQKGGTEVPWLLTWGVILVTALIAVAIAGFLMVTGVSKLRRSR